MSWTVRFHPEVSADLDRIAVWITDYAGPAAATRKLDEIERVIATLADVPHKGTVRTEVAPGVRAIPAGRKGVIVFMLNDEQREVLILAVTYSGADWASLSVSRHEG